LTDKCAGRKYANGGSRRTTTSSEVAGYVRFEALAKLTSTADMRREAAIQNAQIPNVPLCP
ncbi:hypothetical protein, partial [Mesorhizobium sp. M2D.F.Ca.ET.153.01.1.1]|uniref:hypothetical protein n=1 Tax=Mesorhizobium sp. M2D.F.Ca.ET.153.01.1.1 TaxID=2500520 RepID=UPI001AEEDDC9